MPHSVLGCGPETQRIKILMHKIVVIVQRVRSIPRSYGIMTYAWSMVCKGHTLVTCWAACQQLCKLDGVPMTASHAPNEHMALHQGSQNFTSLPLPLLAAFLALPDLSFFFVLHEPETDGSTGAAGVLCKASGIHVSQVVTRSHTTALHST